MTNPNPKGLLLCDYDMFLVHPSTLAWQSLLYAVRTIAPNERAANKLVLVEQDGTLNPTAEMREILHRTSGTTEKFLVAKVAKTLHLPRRRKMKGIRETFYQARLDYYTSRCDADPELAQDRVFPYALSFLRYCKELSFVLLRCTGNPMRLMSVREPQELAELFEGGVYGDQAATRADLILMGQQLGLEMYPELEIQRDRLGYPLNVVYGADAEGDIRASLSAGVRMILTHTTGPRPYTNVHVGGLFHRINEIAESRGLSADEIERLISPVDVTHEYNQQYAEWLLLQSYGLSSAELERHFRDIRDTPTADHFTPAVFLPADNLGSVGLWKNMAILAGEKPEVGIEARAGIAEVDWGVTGIESAS